MIHGDGDPLVPVADGRDTAAGVPGAASGSDIPSIEGSVVLGHVELLSRLLSSGELSRSELEGRLSPEDLALLDEPIRVSAWYDARERYLAFGRDLRLISTLSGSILNFSHQQVKEDPEHSDRWLLETSEAAAYPEILCWTSQGFFNRMAQVFDAARRSC